MFIKTSASAFRPIVKTAFVRWNSTQEPIGPFCTVVGHKMTGFTYARAAANLISEADSKGGSSSQPVKEAAKAKRKDNIASHFQAALNDGQSNKSPTREDLPYAYPPDSFPPVIVSLWLDEPLQAYLSSLRAKYFPTTKNYLQGHITLFHALPSTHLDIIMEITNAVCSDTAEFEVFCENSTLSRHAAVFIPLKARRLVSVRTDLLGSFKRSFNLTNQDINPNFWPHATVINKVPREEAERVFDEVKSMSKEDRVTHGRAKGLDVWFYRGGPWEHLHRIPFGKS